MRQRVEIWHGTIEAGPRPDGGWRVHTTLPFEDEAAAGPGGPAAARPPGSLGY
jgi:hypothetical protein